MSGIVLVVAANALDAGAVLVSLDDARDIAPDCECAYSCGAGLQRLCDTQRAAITAVVIDLFLPDSQGLATLKQYFNARPLVPILVLSQPQDESTARLAVQQGAQDYLLMTRVDRYTLPKALRSMIARSTRAQALRSDSARARVTLDSIGDAVITTDVSGLVTYLNPVATSMTGWPQEEALGRPLNQVLQIVDAESREPSLNPLEVAMLRNATVGLSENCLLIRRDGFEIAIEDTAAPIHDHLGQVTGAVVVFHDVGAARAMSMRMSHLAQHDSLTGLPNRMLLNDRLDRATALAHRNGTSLALMFVDVDRFKHVNDSLGHAIGDELLRSIARRLVSCVRSSDTVSRHGGDEFIVLLPALAHGLEAAISAQKMLEAIGRVQRIDGHDLSVAVSIGISVFPDDGTDAETLLKRADAALLNAKADGRGVYRFFSQRKEVQEMNATRVRYRTQLLNADG